MSRFSIAKFIAGQRLYDKYWKPYDVEKPFGGDNIGPYPWQVEYHNATFNNDRVGFIAANQVGKTQAEMAQVAMNLTGIYPPWYKGRRWGRGIEAWVCGIDNQLVRDSLQVALFGKPDYDNESKMPDGSGWIPKDMIIYESIVWQTGFATCIDNICVRNANGGMSRLWFKGYKQGKSKFQSVTLDLMAFDEEPEDFSIFSEALTRLVAQHGLFLYSSVALKGLTPVVAMFVESKSERTWWSCVGWDQAYHLSEDAKISLLESYPEHERETRSKGTIMLGEGAVYPVPDEMLIVDPFEIPDHWALIVGLDFGIAHATAAVWAAHNRDTDTIYLYDCYQAKDRAIPYHASAIKSKGKDIPVAWPHDGFKRDAGSGVPMAAQYRAEGVRMLAGHARESESEGAATRTPKESIVQAIHTMMVSGRFKVFSGIMRPWLIQKNYYHRKDGVIKAVNDDLMAATEYAVMMRRFAQPKSMRGMSGQIMVTGGGANYDPLRRR